MNPGAETRTALENGFRVGEWQVDPNRETIRREAQTRHLEHKVMQTLLELALHAGEVVTREQFLDSVWQGRVVNEEALSRTISLLRAALEDDPHEPRYIQTIPRTGYRLVAAVSAPAPKATSRRARLRMVAPWLAGLALVGFAALLLLRPWLVTEPRRVDSVAVLPFQTLDGPDNAYIAAGLTEELGTALARVPGLRVVPGTWTRGLSPEQLRGRVNVSMVTEGTVRQQGERVRISARIVEADSGVQVWASSFERDFRDLFALQHEIANAIAIELRGTLEPVAQNASSAPAAEAYRAFLLGRYHLERRGAVNIRKAMALLEQAVREDPQFIDAALALARSYALLPSYEPVAEEAMLRRAEQVLDELGARVPDADRGEGLRGFIALRRGFWIEAQEHFDRARGNADEDVETLQWHSVLLAAMGHLGAARAQAERAVGLDPLSPITNYRLASICTWQGDDECAGRQATLAIELGLDPLASPEPRLLLLVRQRAFEELAQTLTALQVQSGGSVEWVGPWLAALENPGAREREHARRALDNAYQAGGLSVRFLFGAAITMGDGEAGLAAAQELITQGHFPDSIEAVYSFEGAVVRAQPQFMQLARASGLANYWERFGGPDQQTGVTER